MAYQLKYYFDYIPINQTLPVSVELWQNTEDVLVAEEIKAMEIPFLVEIPELENKFQVVIGRGCTINLLSDSDMKFFNGLYHVDPQEFMIKKYDINNNPEFYGYLNAEMVTEPYDINFNYPFSITGNDGFSLMDRFSFVQSDGTNYTGIKSKFELLQIIFGKIALPYDEYRIALSTTFTGYSGNADYTILHESYVNCANFYDEDNKPMTLREVIESVLAPYGAHIFAEQGHIYIKDIHITASNTSITYKRFSLSTGNYIADIAINNSKSIADVKYMGTGQQIELSGGVNRQVVAYSPYPFKTIIGGSLSGVDEFETVPVDWSVKNDFYYKTLINNQSWEIDSIYDFVLDPPTFEASWYENESDASVYLRHKTYTGSAGHSQRIAYLKNKPYVNITGISLIDPTNPPQYYATKYYKGTAIFISGEMLVKTKLNPYRQGVELSYLVIKILVTMKIKIGNYYYDGSIGKWTTTNKTFTIEVSTSQGDYIADTFVPIGKYGNGVIVPIGNYDEEIILDGQLEIEIWSRHVTYTKIGSHENFASVMELWWKNLSIDISNLDGSSLIDSDIEYIGLLDPAFQNEGEKVTLTCGTDSRFSDRAKIMKKIGDNYSSITEWTRASQTFKIEELLLGSLCSNYKAGFITLTNMKLKNAFLIQNVITDSYLGTKKLMVKSAKINDRDNIIECDLVEIKPDELIIVK